MIMYTGKGSLEDLKDDLQRVERAMDAILLGFAWQETPEGHDYWEEVYSKLTKRFVMIEAKIAKMENVK